MKMSKGSRQRPYDKKKFDDNWDRIFKKDEADKETEERCVDYEDYETWRSGTEEEDDSGC
jgi:hypothetical protein